MKSLRHSFLKSGRLALTAALVLGSNLASLPAFAVDDPKQEKRLEALEDKFFSQTYKSDSDDIRLGRVEDMLFNHANHGATEDRLTSLEDALSTIKTSTKTPPARASAADNAIQSGSGGTAASETNTSNFNNSRYKHFTDMDDQDSKDLDDDGFNTQVSNFYNQANAGSAKNSSMMPGVSKSGSLITQQLAAMETQIFGKPNLKMPLTTRIKKLEQNVLASSSDTSSMSLPDRVKNLWTNLNTPGATTGSASTAQSKGSPPQPVANKDSAPTQAVNRKRSQAKASDDSESDDQAMAEYLQKLRKGNSTTTSGATGGKDSATVKKGRNKSGWMDDAEIPKGQDPDFASTDDNSPIVIGGSGNQSSMQAQGFVQNLGSGMPMQMKSNGTGLFSKLGQAIGGAVSGANNTYGTGYGSGLNLGNGIYGGGMPYGYGAMSPYGMSPYSGFGGYGGFSPYGVGYGAPVMGPPMGVGGYGVNPYGLGGPRPGNPYGANPYAVSPYGGASPYALGRRL